jgi:exopolyphosphatase/guanosine-5'-triphosphate,3'-diphosphate pyrophosphatase
LSQDDRHTVRALSAVLRVADALDRSHYGVVRDVTVAKRANRVTLQLSLGGDAALELWEAQQRSGLLAEVLGTDVEFRAAS